MMILKIARQDAAQVAFVEDDDVVQTFAADRADEALDIGFCQGDRGAVTTFLPEPSNGCTAWLFGSHRFRAAHAVPVPCPADISRKSDNVPAQSLHQVCDQSLARARILALAAAPALFRKKRL
jgi:hypothetical protein